MRTIRYVAPEDVLVIHHAIVETTGGSHGVRDLNLFHSILERPKGTFGGKEFFSTVHEKAAAVMAGFAHYHVFVDGNKRTAFAVTVRFFSINGELFTAKNSEVVKFMLKVVEEKLDVPAIARWLKKHTQPE